MYSCSLTSLRTLEFTGITRFYILSCPPVSSYMFAVHLPYDLMTLL